MEHDSRNLHFIKSTDLSPAICRVAKYGMTERGEVNPKLMGSPRSGVKEDMGGNFPISLIHLVLRR